MADPTPYTRGYSFSGFQANNPSKPLPGASVDEELDNVGNSVNETIEALADIRRDDGTIDPAAMPPEYTNYVITRAEDAADAAEASAVVSAASAASIGDAVAVATASASAASTSAANASSSANAAAASAAGAAISAAAAALTPSEPGAPNGDFEWWPNDITSVAIPANGQQVGTVYATMDTDDAMVIGRASGGGLQVTRGLGQSDAMGMCVVPVNFVNADARRYRGNYITVSFEAVKGAGYVAANNEITANLYANDTVGSIQSSNGIPAGSPSTLSANTLVLTTSWQQFSFTTPAVVANTVNQLALRFRGKPPTGTPAIADDYFAIRKLRFDRGQSALAFRNESAAASALRALGLDQGDWTPTLTFATPGDVNTLNGTGTWTRVGNRYFCEFTISGTTSYTTASGQLRITGLPAPAGTSNGGAAVIDINLPTWNDSATYVVFRTTAGQSYIYIDGNKPAGGAAVNPLTVTNLPTATAFNIVGNFSYRAA